MDEITEEAVKEIEERIQTAMGNLLMVGPTHQQVSVRCTFWDDGSLKTIDIIPLSDLPSKEPTK